MTRNMQKKISGSFGYSRLFLLIGVIYGIFFLGPSMSPLTAREQLVSNVEGKIRVVILHYGGKSRFWFDETVLFRQLLDKMDKDVCFVILHGKDRFGLDIGNRMADYRQQLLPDGTPRVKFLKLDVKTSDFYPWARDGYVILADNSGNLIFQDAGFNRGAFPITVFDRVFKNARTRAGVIHLGGGNIRATNDEIFLGADSILGEKITPFGRIYSFNEVTLYSKVNTIKKESIDTYKRRFHAHILRIQNLLGQDKKFVIPGESFLFSKLEKGTFKASKTAIWHTGAQAAYHTDVYLGVGHKDKTGKRVIFIADSNKGAEIVEKVKPEQRRAMEKKLPDLLVKEGFNIYGIPLNAQQIAAHFKWAEFKLLDLCIKRSRKIGKTLDQFARHLKKTGYHVVRIPSLSNGLMDDNDANDGTRGISFNYSNVLVEVYGNVRRVYYPVFGFNELDAAAADAYRGAGYETIPIEGLLTNGVTPVEDGAGLDCMTSELRFPVKWNEKYHAKTVEDDKNN